jgi:hypothetical protein
MQKLSGSSAHLTPIAVKDSLYIETESPNRIFLLSYPRTDCFTAPASGGLRTPGPKRPQLVRHSRKQMNLVGQDRVSRNSVEPSYSV